MKVVWKHAVPGGIATFIVCLMSVTTVGSQAPAAPAPSEKPLMAEEVFKNVQVLKGIPADEFLDTMGMFANALLYDCASCHVPEVVFPENRAAFAKPTPEIQRARQMVVMMNNINRTYFGGERRVTCFTCHRGDYAPPNVASLALQYSATPPAETNSMTIDPLPAPSADQIFATYLKALGGTQVAKLTSIVATGIYSGFDTGDTDVPLEIYARAPNQRTEIVRGIIGGLGDSVRTFDGVNAWKAGPDAPVPLTILTGGNLAGARIEAIVAFPAGIQQAFSQWQVGSADIDGKPVRVVQGTNPGQLPVNLYFDESGLLVRLVRWSQTAVGIIPTQIDYSDYREVAGIRVPHRWAKTWTNGQSSIRLNKVQVNVSIDAAKFARPSPGPSL